MGRKPWCRSSRETLLWAARWELALALHLGAWPLWSQVAAHLQRDTPSDEDLKYDWIYDGVQWDAKCTIERSGSGSQLLVKERHPDVFYALGEHGEEQSACRAEVIFHYTGGIMGDGTEWIRDGSVWRCPREAFLGRYRPNHGIHPPTV